MRKYGVDKKGFIITKVGLRKIKPDFKKVQDTIKKEVINKFGDKIHSLYLYGSVATGKAHIKTSDLDLLLILKQKPSSKISNRIIEFENYLSSEYINLFRNIGISITNADKVKKDTYGWGCFIKHLCICLYGENLGRNLPNFKPSKKVAKAFNGDIGKHIKTVLEKLKETTNPQEIYLICRGIMRKIVHTGFCLVMERERSWTTDLKKSYEIFSKYYPKQSACMKKAFTLAQKPTRNTKELKEFLKDFGSWLTVEAKKKL
jgi:uncharacterized protein